MIALISFKFTHSDNVSGYILLLIFKILGELEVTLNVSIRLKKESGKNVLSLLKVFKFRNVLNADRCF